MAQAEEYAHRALSILNREQRPDTRAVAVAEATLAGVYLHSHDPVSAEKILPRAVEIERGMAVSPNTLAASVELLGELRGQQRRWTEAEALYREALDIYERHGATNGNPVIAPLLPQRRIERRSPRARDTGTGYRSIRLAIHAASLSA
jgi:Tfp pilus assembly protein PilF